VLKRISLHSWTSSTFILAMLYQNWYLWACKLLLARKKSLSECPVAPGIQMVRFLPDTQWCTWAISYTISWHKSLIFVLLILAHPYSRVTKGTVRNKINKELKPKCMCSFNQSKYQQLVREQLSFHKDWSIFQLITTNWWVVLLKWQVNWVWPLAHPCLRSGSSLTFQNELTISQP
jgi:hypothetical protein